MLAVMGGRPVMAAEVSSQPPTMPVAGRAVPPAGLFDYCRRTPLDCLGSTGDTAHEAQRLRVEAGRAYWAGVFGRRAITPSATSRPDRYDWSLAFGRSRARVRPVAAMVARAIDDETAAAPSVDDAVVAAVAVAAPEAEGQGALAAGDLAGVSEPAVEVITTPAASTFVFDKAGWDLINRVNRRVNRGIRRASDDRLYGVEDFWAAPTARGARGDCEDYVLAKRRALIDAGVPAEALSIAIVETRWGETHAVLLVAGDRGEFVLDNLTPWVARWDRVNYRWRSRQSGADLFDWARLDI